MADWVITIPKTTKWSEYQREIEAVRDGKTCLNYRLGFRPRAVIGEKCYIVHDGFIKGWMEIVGILASPGFTCTTTGLEYGPGWYIQRSGEFHPIEPIPMKGFRGIRRI